ncbi:hypothetical protein BHM03_00055166 [Ensete ventricosum]|uniref:Uncharacterized protein n=1 Tax=Ensete ventricosum TaxID=4639 RepID=A0A445MM72_ENSVE|nr:hypothetical protein BHM03_00055166 [Ensete ventricosum]
MASRLKTFLRPFSAYRSVRTRVGGESFVYRQSMIRRPSTVRRDSVPWNWCSFIGTVIRPVKRSARKGAYTVLESFSIAAKTLILLSMLSITRSHR